MQYADSEEAKRLIADFVGSLHNLAGSVDCGILCKESLRVTSTVASQLHVGLPACPCARIASTWIRRAVDAPAVHLPSIVEEWAGEFFAACSATHPETVAEEIARRIRRAPCQRWKIRELSKEFAVAAPQLSREFRRVFGTSVPRYVCRARILRGFDALADPDVKIEALLSELGYRSRTNFFDAVTSILGVPSRILRRMRPEDHAVMKASLREMLLPSRRQSPPGTSVTRPIQTVRYSTA